jgi:hypothetical protein
MLMEKTNEKPSNTGPEVEPNQTNRSSILCDEIEEGRYWVTGGRSWTEIFKAMKAEAGNVAVSHQAADSENEIRKDGAS